MIVCKQSKRYKFASLTMTDIVQQQWHNHKQEKPLLCVYSKHAKHGVACRDAAGYKFGTKYLWIHFSLAWILILQNAFLEAA